MSSKPLALSQIDPVLQVKAAAVIAARNDFKDNKINFPSESYDLRTYYNPDNKQVYYPWVFSKTLTHNSVTGFPLKEDVDKVLNAYKLSTPAALNQIVQSNVNQRKFENLTAGQSFNLIGCDSTISNMTNMFPVDNNGSIFEMVEVYAMSLLRDTTFNDIKNLSPTNLYLQELNNFSNKTTAPVDINGNITGNTLFKGNRADELVGPYMSQFLYLPFSYGNLHVDQKYRVENDYNNSTNLTEWLSIENGKINGDISFGDYKYVYNPRVLGSLVHNDPFFQFYFNACLIALQNGVESGGFTNSKITEWTSTGTPNICASVAHVTVGALRTAWCQKWGINMGIRPEVYAQRVHLSLNTTPTILNNVPGLNTIKTTLQSNAPTILADVKTNNSPNNTYLLKLQYPEGSPTHPTCPSGHATVAGACITVMKAMFKTHDNNYSRLPWPVQAKHSLNGDILVNYTELDASSMTIVGELNKLASNSANGRDWAGLHFRHDADGGILLGEQYGERYLVDIAKEYNESTNGIFTGWVSERFNGQIVLITKDGVKILL
jgi:membrane-associated phospholipid phosphatase